jgi:hypothetical protein
MYCGTEVPAPPRAPARTPPPAAPVAGPEPLDSIQAVVRLLEVAQVAMLQGEAQFVKRSVSRIFLEIPPEDLGRILSLVTGRWLKGMKALTGPIQLDRASAFCRQAIEAATHQQWAKASQHFTEARVVYAELARLHPMIEMLALGARFAIERSARTEVR